MDPISVQLLRVSRNATDDRVVHHLAANMQRFDQRPLLHLSIWFNYVFCDCLPHISQVDKVDISTSRASHRCQHHGYQCTGVLP